MMSAIPPCAVCGGLQYTDRAVIWDALAAGWGISAEERLVVDRQQGTCCTACGGNLRSIALADAILAACGWGGRLRDFVESEQAQPIRLLEINEAGTLSPALRRLSGLPEHEAAHADEVRHGRGPGGDKKARRHRRPFRQAERQSEGEDGAIERDIEQERGEIDRSK